MNNVHFEKTYFNLEDTVLQSRSQRYGPISQEVKPNVIWKWYFGECDLLSRLMSQNITRITRGAAECDMKVIFWECAVWHSAWHTYRNRPTASRAAFFKSCLRDALFLFSDYFWPNCVKQIFWKTIYNIITLYIYWILF